MCDNQSEGCSPVTYITINCGCNGAVVTDTPPDDDDNGNGNGNNGNGNGNRRRSRKKTVAETPPVTT